MSTETEQQKHAYFWGVLRSQLMALVIVAALFGLVFGFSVALAAAWGATITVIAYAWAGFQLWLHPSNIDPQRAATSAVRAEIGKVLIMLLLFWATFKYMPMMTEQSTAAALFINFLFAQIAGFIWIARNTGGHGDNENATTFDK